MTGDDVFHADDDDLNLDDEFVLQDWEDGVGTDAGGMHLRADEASGEGLGEEDAAAAWSLDLHERETSPEAAAAAEIGSDGVGGIEDSQEILASSCSEQTAEDVPPHDTGEQPPEEFGGVQASVLAEQTGVQEGVGWHEFDLDSAFHGAFEEIVDRSAAQAAEQDSGQFDLLTGAEDELILIDDNGLEQVPAAGANHVEVDGGDEGSEWTEIDACHTDSQVHEDSDPEWAPVDEVDQYDDDYEETAGDHEAPGFEADRDYSDDETAHYVETDGRNLAGVVRHAWWRRVAGIAAALAILSLSSVYFRKSGGPETSVHQPEPGVITVQQPVSAGVIEEPSLVTRNAGGDTVAAKAGSTIANPIDAEVAESDTAGSDSVGTGIPKTDPTTIGSTGGAVAKMGAGATGLDSTNEIVANLEPEGVGTRNPGEDRADPKSGASAGSQITFAGGASVDDSPVQMGAETLTILGGSQESDIMDRHRQTIVQDEHGLVMGGRARAQLFNDSILVGTVKALNSSFVTLRIGSGEITLARKSIRSLTSLALGGAKERSNGVKTGFVRLRNSNLLQGQIVEIRNEAVIVQVKSNQVVVPLSDVKEVIYGSAENSVYMRDTIRVERDEWFRKLVEEGMQSKTGASDEVTGPATGRPEK